MRLLPIAVLLFAVAADAQSTLTDEERAYLEMVKSSISYDLPGSADVDVRKDLRYSDADPRLLADIYVPAAARADERFPVVFFIHGGGGLNTPVQPKNWGPYISWGRAAAASGMIGVTFNHRLGFPEPHLDDAAADVVAMSTYVRSHAAELHADPERVCLAAYSAGGPLLSLGVRSDIGGVKCLVSFYSFLDVRKTIYGKYEPAEKLEAFSLRSYLEKTPQKIPPLFIGRGGRDQIADLNRIADDFIATALQHNLNFIVANHPEGKHGFDFQGDDRSREIVQDALRFMQSHLGVNDAASRLSSVLLDVESRRRAAIAAKDFETLKTIYADDFKAVFGNGAMINRAALFDVFAHDDGSLTFSTDELEVRQFGDAATVIGRLTGRRGSDVVTQQRFTHVYASRNGHWIIVAAEGTPVR